MAHTGFKLLENKTVLQAIFLLFMFMGSHLCFASGPAERKIGVLEVTFPDGGKRQIPLSAAGVGAVGGAYEGRILQIYTPFGVVIDSQGQSGSFEIEATPGVETVICQATEDFYPTSHLIHPRITEIEKSSPQWVISRQGQDFYLKMSNGPAKIIGLLFCRNLDGK